MISFEEFYLDNGLQVIVHSDHQSPIVCLNTLYKVGSRNEQPDKTGFAHLFEHLMFGGSANIPVFDEPLQAVGGENNAFTNTDITNYYTTVPAINVETAFWLESDRMLSLSFDPKVLEVQRSVVIEEFKQRYLNQPYGDAWLKMRSLAYQVHPYQWPTIGKSIDHVADATMEDVRNFFERYYHPANAILVIAGDITLEKAKSLTEKWYGPLVGKSKLLDTIPAEPSQTAGRELTCVADVPQDAIYKVFHMPARAHESFYAVELMADLLGNAKSSWLYQKLVKETPVFTQISASVTGSIDPGLVVISGRVQQDVSVEQANEQLEKAISNFIKKEVGAEELQRAKNLYLSTITFNEVEVLNRAMSLAFGAFLGNINLINDIPQSIEKVNGEQIREVAGKYLALENSSTLFYKKGKNEAKY